MKPLIVANWKMNPQSAAEAEDLFGSVEKGAGSLKGVDIVVCPPSLYLLNLKLLKVNLRLGAQNVFWEEQGAYTGEVSASMLKKAGSEYIIVGHSERRRYFGETNERVNKKIKAILEEGLNPILCIGETKEEREQGKISNILEKEITSAFKNVSSSRVQISNLIIAYEPIWAIGSGKACPAREARKISLIIKKIISKFYSPKIAQKSYILYGGSVNSQNAESYIQDGGMNGLLIGGASLKAEEFIRIIKLIASLR